MHFERRGIMVSALEAKLLEVGFNGFTKDEKNNFVMELANKLGMAFTDVTEAYIFEYHRILKSEVMSLTCEDTILKGFTASNGHYYRTDRDDQTNMLGQKEYLRDHPDTTTVEWKTEDEGRIPHTKEEWIGVFYEAFAFKDKTLKKLDRIKKKIATATNDFEITAIKWATFDTDFPETPPEHTDYVEPTEAGGDGSGEGNPVVD
jgi:hypothetical protein